MPKHALTSSRSHPEKHLLKKLIIICLNEYLIATFVADMQSIFSRGIIAIKLVVFTFILSSI